LIDSEPSDPGNTAAELYADRFDFDVIDWRQPPFDPRDLALTIQDLASTNIDVLIVDSGSPFWRGRGGTLDIADGRFGGWKSATPAQDDLVAAILNAPFHVIFCTRAKQEYAVEQESGGRQTVRKLGLAPIQRDDLEYEFQVVAMIDVEHRIDIGKTRCAALAGASFHANQQGVFASTLKGWLDQGPTLLRQVDVDLLASAFNRIDDKEERGALKEAFVGLFGKPATLDRDAIGGAWAWLSAQCEMDLHEYSADPNGGDGLSDGESVLCSVCGLVVAAPWHISEPDDGGRREVPEGEPSPAEVPPDDVPVSDDTEAEPAPSADDVAIDAKCGQWVHCAKPAGHNGACADLAGHARGSKDAIDAEPGTSTIRAEVDELSLPAVIAELAASNCPTGGSPAAVRKRLYDLRVQALRPAEA
jgi:hypothetical protein